MQCSECKYETNNKKSFSNHNRYRCKCVKFSSEKCKYCDKFKPKRKPSEKGLFCDRKCYSLWRSEYCKGEKAPNYKDGKCGERLLIRASLKYREWRKAVFYRDNYTCQKCGDDTGGNLEADHIKSFALFPEFRFDITNGRTLCRKCHKLTDNYGYTKQNSKADKI